VLDGPLCCGEEPEAPAGGADEVGEAVVVLVDSLDEEDDEEDEEEDEDVVVEDDPPSFVTGGLIAGTAPPEAGELSESAVSPPPVSAEMAIRRSQRRGALITSLAGPSLIGCRSPLMSLVGRPPVVER
jgi:hypothetical protein